MENFGFLSILPPLIAVLIAIRYRNVIIALFLGTFVGVTILHGWNPIEGISYLIKDYFFVQVADSFNASVIVLLSFVGGFVALITKSGGAAVLAQKSAHLVHNRRQVQVAAWLGGLSIFFSDLANALLLGPIFQPMTDRLKVSREKLAWILDSTSSPVCILVPFIGWGIYVMGLIQKQFEILGIQESEWGAFIKAIPFQFYPLGVLLMVPLVAFLGVEFSAMYKAERRTLDTGETFWPGSVPMRPSETIEISSEATPSGWIIGLPLLILFVCFFGLLAPLGFPFTQVSGSMIRMALSVGYFLGAMACLLMMVKSRIKTLGEASKIYGSGMKDMFYILVVLVLAWSLSSVCKNMGTASYIVNLAQGTIPGWSVPLIIFLTGGCISFATGSSWGTFAILLPIAMPMAHSLGAPMYASIAAVLSGGLFGDHCSPISDTTILSSTGASCDHVDHVKTQLPYALTVALASSLGYVVAGFVGSPLVLFLALGFLVLLVLLFGRLWGQKLV